MHYENADHIERRWLLRWSGSHPAYVAQNMDLESFRNRFQVVLHIAGHKSIPEQFVFTQAGMIALNGVNHHSIGIVCNALMQLNASSNGLPVAFVLRGVLAQTNETEALKFVRNLPHATGQNYIIGVGDRCYSLTVRTVEAHGACPIDTDNIVPLKMAELFWDKCNALVAPAINHGVTSPDLSQFPGSTAIRPQIFEEYVQDVLKDLVRTGFRDILVLDGHGGKREWPGKRLRVVSCTVPCHGSDFPGSRRIPGTNRTEKAHQYKTKGVVILAADGMSYTEKSELSADGKTWVPNFERRATKVRPPRAS